jgi:hypothetical protein
MSTIKAYNTLQHVLVILYWKIKKCSVQLLRNKRTFCRNGKHCQKARTTDKPRKNKIYDSGKEKHLKKGTFENKKLQI